jgi:hypothetical protein
MVKQAEKLDRIPACGSRSTSFTIQTSGMGSPRCQIPSGAGLDIVVDVNCRADERSRHAFRISFRLGEPACSSTKVDALKLAAWFRSRTTFAVRPAKCGMLEEQTANTESLFVGRAVDLVSAIRPRPSLCTLCNDRRGSTDRTTPFGTLGRRDVDSTLPRGCLCIHKGWKNCNGVDEK